ncbi:hypothetical protein GBAR_LOCUS20827 [Geodia barretti]|uniref:Uncharacterized protein n=1 Tax=Geodia barretti TaxID=519541 RepID=A0AA35SX90_GEOBA|nr:hypothetical protein GBAR_LOCUS20827 [Geodia barretti]
MQREAGREDPLSDMVEMLQLYGTPEKSPDSVAE